VITSSKLKTAKPPHTMSISRHRGDTRAQRGPVLRGHLSETRWQDAVASEHEEVPGGDVLNRQGGGEDAGAQQHVGRVGRELGHVERQSSEHGPRGSVAPAVKAFPGP